ncbi:MAG: hypothetical protein WDM96_06330 [Lacunisphaera sp.]
MGGVDFREGGEVLLVSVDLGLEPGRTVIGYQPVKAMIAQRRGILGIEAKVIIEAGLGRGLEGGVGGGLGRAPTKAE